MTGIRHPLPSTVPAQRVMARERPLVPAKPPSSSRRAARLLVLAVALLGLVVLAAPASAGSPGRFGDLVFANAFERPTRATGGSNFLWHDLGPACEREPYGIVPNYHLPAAGGGSVRGRVQQQLATMHARGMRRLSLGLFFGYGRSSGTVIDAGNPAAVTQAVANLELLLADVKAAGYREILFRFFPIAEITPSWEGFVPARIEEYWNLITAVRPVVKASGLHYRLDLMVEGMPRDRNPKLVPDPWKYPANPEWSRAVRTLWQRYTAAYGTADTVGFSFFLDVDVDARERVRHRVRHMRYVYEKNYPSLFAADIYGTATMPEADKFIALHDAMVREDSNGKLGWRDAGWIIAESYYDDPFAAEVLASAIAATGRTVFYLTQWPLDRARLDCNADVNAPPPLDWTVYGGFGY